MKRQFLGTVGTVTNSDMTAKMEHKNYLIETLLLDFSNEKIQLLIKAQKWLELDTVERVKSIYNYVRDDIKFGYNVGDDIPASQILEDNYGQCNTKSTLLMALLRATGIPCRIHGFTIDKALQKGAITDIWYKFSPKNIIHSWVEANVNNIWYNLEGVILDKQYLVKLQVANNECKTTFCGFGVCTDNFQNPTIDWNLNNTYIQDKGINQDFGLFDSPDDFYKTHTQKLNFIKRFMFKYIVRHLMNKNVSKIRKR